VVHDTSGSGQDDLTERSSGQQQGDPVLNSVQGNVESRGDDTGLVQSAVELNDNLAASVVVDDFEFANVTYVRGRKVESVRGAAFGTRVKREERECASIVIQTGQQDPSTSSSGFTNRYFPAMRP
jgi:hypothetical protein